jgi:uncharacterized heparinase superfamily protein
MEARGSALIVDTGRPPPPAFSKDAHAGCLAFEFSFGGERIIVNCGAPGPNRAAAREIARTSAAHSTLIIDDTSSCRFSSSAGLDRFFEGQILSGPTRVEVARADNAGGEHLALSHDGYAARFGFVHARTLRLASDGARLSGEDSLLRTQEPGTAAAHRFALRFHLHPSVKAALIWDGQGVVLDMPSGERFTFDAEGRDVRVEDSIFFAAPNGPRNSRQIVIDARIEGDVTIGWSLERVVE